MSNKQMIALGIIFVYMIATIVLGLAVSKIKAAKAGKQSNDDFLMASKSLGPVVLAGTLFAANTGGASTTGIATNVYTYGLSASWYVIAAGIGFVLVSFIAPYFRKAQPAQCRRSSERDMGRHPTFLRHLLPSPLCLWLQEPRSSPPRPSST